MASYQKPSVLNPNKLCLRTIVSFNQIQRFPRWHLSHQLRLQQLHSYRKLPLQSQVPDPAVSMDIVKQEEDRDNSTEVEGEAGLEEVKEVGQAGQGNNNRALNTNTIPYHLIINHVPKASQHLPLIKRPPTTLTSRHLPDHLRTTSAVAASLVQPQPETPQMKDLRDSRRTRESSKRMLRQKSASSVHPLSSTTRSLLAIIEHATSVPYGYGHYTKLERVHTAE